METSDTIATVKVQGPADAAQVLADVLGLTFGSVVLRPSDQDQVHIYDVDTASSSTRTTANGLADLSEMDVDITGPAFTQDIDVPEFGEVSGVEYSPARKVVNALEGYFEDVDSEKEDDSSPFGQERYRARVSVGRRKG